MIEHYMRCNLTGQTIIRKMQRTQEDQRSMQMKGQETAVKRRDTNNELLSKELLVTPSPLRMHLYRPATLKLITTMARPIQNTNSTLTFILLARINAIRRQGTRYWLRLSDDTADGANLQAYYSQTGSPNEKGVSELEFEGESGEGQPYFWVWVRARESGWSVEMVQRATVQAIGHHWCCVMLSGGE